jgi:sugar lactone lactonase YvrE
MVKIGSPIERPHGTPDGEKYLRIDDSGDEIQAVVNFPRSTYYEFHGVVRSWTNCDDALFVQIDDEIPRRWDIIGDGCRYWRWSDSRARIYVTAGSHTVRILHNAQTVDVDAILIRRSTCRPRTCATLGAVCTRIDDGCGGILDCPCTVETIATVGGTTKAIAVDDTHVYFTVRDPDGDGDKVMKVDKSGGIPAILSSSVNNSYDITVDGSNVYWTNYNNGTVIKVAKTGGPSTTLADDYHAMAITTDGKAVYWTNEYSEGRIMKISKGGGVAVTLASNQNRPKGIAVDGGHVYWANWGDGKIMKVVKEGGVISSIASNQNSPGWIAADTTGVYWVNRGVMGAQSGSVKKLPDTTIVEGQNWPNSLVIDETHVYWVTSATSVSGYTDGAVWMAPKNANWTVTPFTIASDQGRPQDLAVDQTHVYWTTGNEVRRAPLQKDSDILVTTVTTGENIDSNGYAVVLNDTQHRLIDTNGMVAFSNQAAGEHKIELSGVANNCNIEGEPSRTVQVATAQTAEIEFRIDCRMAGKVAFASTRHRQLPPQWGTPEWSDIWVINADGTGLVNLTDDEYVDSDPVWFWRGY